LDLSLDRILNDDDDMPFRFTHTSWSTQLLRKTRATFTYAHTHMHNEFYS